MTDYENVLLWPELLAIEHLDWQGFSLVLPTIIRLKTTENGMVIEFLSIF